MLRKQPLFASVFLPVTLGYRAPYSFLPFSSKVARLGTSPCSKGISRELKNRVNACCSAGFSSSHGGKKAAAWFYSKSQQKQAFTQCNQRLYKPLAHCSPFQSCNILIPLNKTPNIFNKRTIQMISRNIQIKSLQWIPTEYSLETFQRSNQDTSLTHKPSVFEGSWVQSGDLLTDCASSVGGELSLGQNILIAYMPWEGYNFEDAILISERLVVDDLYTSVHIERYDIETHETKLGFEEITRNIPDISQKDTQNLDTFGIIKMGSWIEEGDILVGKITPINKKNISPYQKLLYTILEKPIRPIRDSSLRAPKGIKAKVIDIKYFLRKSENKQQFVPAVGTTTAVCSPGNQIKKENLLLMEKSKDIAPFDQIFSKQNNSSQFLKKLNTFFNSKKKMKLLSSFFPISLFSSFYKSKSFAILEKFRQTQFCSSLSKTKKTKYRNTIRNKGRDFYYRSLILPSLPRLSDTKLDSYTSLSTLQRGLIQPASRELNESFQKESKMLAKWKESKNKRENQNINNSSSIRNPILKNKYKTLQHIEKIHIYLAEKRKIQVGDKMAGRHGNKGIVSQILPIQDMPYLPDGTPVDMVLNPLGVPSRMNVGQIYECLLGLAGKYLGEHYKVYSFDEIYGPEASRSFVFNKLYEARLKTKLEWLFDPNSPGKIQIYDGRTGEYFDQFVTVGQAYILRLVHMVDDKIHSRSTGPYSLVTQQPLRGRSKQGGQRLGEMEVWALEGYGAAFTLLEMLTIKSDDMTGRMTLWSNLILNKDISIGTPESFKVLVCELQALCLDIGLFRYTEPSTSNLMNSTNNTSKMQSSKPYLREIQNLINLP